MGQRAGQEIGWVPKTKLGKQVQQGEIISMEEIFTQGLRIKEPEIVDTLLPSIQQEVLGIGFVQKQTDAGERSRFRAIVAVGNSDGYIGVGEGKARQVRTAIDKGTIQAKLNIIPVRRGCGSWECGCGKAHTMPFTVTGKCGSVRIEVLPGPRGLGLVAGEIPKVVLRLAGVRDCWTRTYGSTSTLTSSALAAFDALMQTYSVVTQEDWVS
ncbi:MAG TPA: 30S ribosomal protein S5 [Candidatus Bathyarchaeia archaeon]|nr:30S ribosomal protein S5 [Candidatus Bathyarchaeia archaeon]